MPSRHAAVLERADFPSRARILQAEVQDAAVGCERDVAVDGRTDSQIYRFQRFSLLCSHGRAAFTTRSLESKFSIPDADFGDLLNEYDRTADSGLVLDLLTVVYGARAPEDKRLTAERLLALSNGEKEPIVATILSLRPPKAVANALTSQSVDKRTAFRLLQALFEAATECYAKAFRDGLDIQRAGGCDEAVCPHGSHFALLPIARTESTLDAIKLLVHFKHLPNVAFFDHWCGGKAQLVAECAKVGVFLGERAGALYSEDTKDMRVVSFPALASEECPSFAMSDKQIAEAGHLGVDRPPHPVSGSTLAFDGHDRLHGPSHKKCEGRRPDLIAETRTTNSMRHEQENILREKDASWLRNYTPQRNLLMMRVITHLRDRQRALDYLHVAHGREQEQQKRDPAACFKLQLSSFGQLKLVSATGVVFDL